MNPKAPKLTLQEQCDRLVEQYYDEFAKLREDVAGVVLEVAQVWSGHFPDPTAMHGQLYCTSVRGLLLLYRVGDVRNPDEPPPPAGEIHTRYGQGMSVMVKDGRGWYSRVRRAPAEFFPERGERLVLKPPKKSIVGSEGATDPQSAVQPSLSQEMAALPRTSPKPDWFVLWTLSEDGLQVPDVFLAAVVDIDSPSMVRILASTPLPRNVRRKPVIDEHDTDFNEWAPPSGEEGTGSAPA